MPHIRIHEIRITGPLDGPKAAPFDPSRLRESLEAFAGRAYRRPARKDELDRLMAVAERHSYKAALKAVLCSPASLATPRSRVGWRLRGRGS